MHVHIYIYMHKTQERVSYKENLMIFEELGKRMGM